MPGKGSGAKRFKQSEKRRLRNKMIRSTVRTASKRFLSAIKNNDKNEADVHFGTVTKLIDNAARKGVYHKNNAARKKSRMHKMLNSLNTD